MKRIIFYISFLLVPFLTTGQDNNIIIKLIDVSSGDEISGATIFYNQKYAISDEQGRISISTGTKSSISLVISHVGYETFEKTFTIDQLKRNPRIELKSSLMLLEEVLISGDQRPSFSQKKYDRETVMKNNPKNIGDVFKDKSGFGLIKRGGYAMDPVFDPSSMSSSTSFMMAVYICREPAQTVWILHLCRFHLLRSTGSNW
jgi:hypothetical protein